MSLADPDSESIPQTETDPQIQQKSDLCLPESAHHEGYIMPDMYAVLPSVLSLRQMLFGAG